VSEKSRFSILIISDSTLSKEKTHLLNQTIYELKQEFQVDLIKGEENPSESEIIKQFQEGPYMLLLLPLHLYLNWQLVSETLGSDRISGPTVAGYFCESLSWSQISPSNPKNHRIFLDFCHLTLTEKILLVTTLIFDKQRTGILPLLAPETPIFTENFDPGQGLGHSLDSVLKLPEFVQSDWKKRATCLQILLPTLGGMLNLEGLHLETSSQKACLQVAIDPSCLLMRLWISPIDSTATGRILDLFTPNSEAPTQACQLLLRFCDFLRVHPISGEKWALEVVAGLLPSAPSEKAHGELHTFWYEPIAGKLVSELPFETSSSEIHQVRYRTLSTKRNPIRPPLRLIENQEPNIINDLKNKIREREKTIEELKSGGVGNTKAMEIPEAEALLEGFQERYFDAKHQIRLFGLEIMRIEKNGGTPEQINTLRLKMEALQNRENSWIKKLIATLDDFRKSKS
jgi:hypothetical protein